MNLSKHKVTAAFLKELRRMLKKDMEKYRTKKDLFKSSENKCLCLIDSLKSQLDNKLFDEVKNITDEHGNIYYGWDV